MEASLKPGEGGTNNPVKTKDLDEIFEQQSKVAAEAKLQYIELYRQMTAKLSPKHLEPFAKILLEHEGYALQDQEELIASMRQMLLKSLEGSLEQFWTHCNVTDSLTSLALLKEQFKQYEGIDWEIEHKTPAQRILPMRISLKEASIRFLKKQLEVQNAELEKVLLVNAAYRTSLNETTQERIFLNEAMRKSSADFEQAKQRLKEMQRLLLEVELPAQETIAAADEAGERKDMIIGEKRID